MRSRVPALLAVGLLAAAGALLAQAPPPPAPAPPAPPMPCCMQGHEAGGPGPMPGHMMDDCKAMMGKHQAMKDDMKAMDAKLDGLVKAMNDARGAKKVDATAAVVAELVAQRKTLRTAVETMAPMMMHHMMQHLQAGMMHGAAESMGGCPMMGTTGDAEHHDHPMPH